MLSAADVLRLRVLPLVAGQGGVLVGVHEHVEREEAIQERQHTDRCDDLSDYGADAFLDFLLIGLDFVVDGEISITFYAEIPLLNGDCERSEGVKKSDGVKRRRAK